MSDPTTMTAPREPIGFRAEYEGATPKKIEFTVPASRMKGLDEAVRMTVDVLDSLTPEEATEYEPRLTIVLRRLTDVSVTHDVAWCLSPYCDKRVVHGGDYCDDECATANNRENSL